MKYNKKNKFNYFLLIIFLVIFFLVFTNLYSFLNFNLLSYALENKVKNENLNIENSKNTENTENTENTQNTESTQKYIYHRSDKLLYDSKNKYFELVGNVEIFYEDTKVKCDLFRYYEDKEFGIASGNPALYNPSTFIKSDSVEIYFKIKKLVAKNNVYIKIKNQQENNNPKDKNNNKKDTPKYFEIFTDTLTYNWENEIVYIPTKVKIVSTNLYLYADTLTYNVKNNLIILKGNVYGKKDEQKIWADKLTYNTKKETLIMEGNVKSIIKSEKKNETTQSSSNPLEFKLLTTQDIYNNLIKQNQKITDYFINKYLYSPYITINLNYYTTFDIYQSNDLNYYIYNINQIYSNNNKYTAYIFPSNFYISKNINDCFIKIKKDIINIEFNNTKELYLYFILRQKDEKYLFFENLNELYNNLLNSYESIYSNIYRNFNNNSENIYNSLKLSPILIKEFKFTYYRSKIISEIYDEELINILKNIYKKYNSAYIDINDIQNYNYLLKIVDNFKDFSGTIAFYLDSKLLSFLLTNQQINDFLNLKCNKIVLVNSIEIYNYLNNINYFYSFSKYLFDLSYIYDLKIIVDSNIYFNKIYKKLKPKFEIYFNN